MMPQGSGGGGAASQREAMARSARSTSGERRRMRLEREREKERPFRIDPDDENYIKDLQRPAVIKEDLCEMERRKRVQEILESKNFCRELEQVIKQETEYARSDSEQLKTLQKLSELTLNNSSTQSLHRMGGPPIPIDDLRDSEKYPKEEVYARNRVASLLRLVDLFHWSQGIYSHITCRVPHHSDQLLVNPFGLLFHEVSASSLVKVTISGDIIDSGSTNLGINQAAFLLHSAILAARPDARCVVHLQSAIVTAVSSLKCGLLPICQEAMLIGPVAYHEYFGSDDEEEEKALLVRNLQDKNVLILRNNGIVTVGRTVEEALLFAHHAVIVCETQIMIIRGGGFVVVGEDIEEAAFLTRNLIAACDQQIRAAKAGLENLFIPNENAVRRAHEMALGKASPRRRVREANGNVEGNGEEMGGTPSKSNGNSEMIEWHLGELEWEAFMRVLDNAGFRTGHNYKQPQLKLKTSRKVVCSTSRQRDDVATPPTSTAVGLVDEGSSDSLAAHRISLMRKDQEKIKWLNSPNSYQKIEILESGTDRPKVITKWIPEAGLSSPSHSGTPIKIASPHQFSPFSSNPKEFKEKQRAIKENRLHGQMTAGPQSLVLDGVTFEDLHIVRDEQDPSRCHSERVVTIGTASKGIINRQHQHNAQVYRQLYAPNPFSNETDAKIKQYLEEVESKSPSATPRHKTADDASTYTRSKSPFKIDSPGMDNVSLIQGSLELRQTQLLKLSASMDDGTGAVDGTELSSSLLRSSREATYDSAIHGKTTTRSVSARGTLTMNESFCTFSARSGGFTSDDEIQNAKCQKKQKKKRGILSFLKRSRRDKSSSSK